MRAVVLLRAAAFNLKPSDAFHALAAMARRSAWLRTARSDAAQS